MTGRVIDETWDDSEAELTTEGTIGLLRGLKQCQTVEWSDARLPADKVTVINIDQYHVGESRESPFTDAHLLADA